MLYGRCKERDQIGALLEGARGGQGGVLVVRGEAGIGKHALLADAVEQATGFRLLHTSGVEAEVGLAFAGLQQLLGPVLDRLDRLPPSRPRRCGSCSSGCCGSPDLLQPRQRPSPDRAGVRGPGPDRLGHRPGAGPARLPAAPGAPGPGRRRDRRSAATTEADERQGRAAGRVRPRPREHGRPRTQPDTQVPGGHELA